MEEELKKEGTVDNQFVAFMFLIVGLVILVTVLAAVFFNSVWIPAVLSCTSMMLATIVYIQLDIRRKIPWRWSLGIFLVIPVIYFIIVSITS
jgi:hypothetical protein